MLVELRDRKGPPHPPTVLLVDDEPDILEGLSSYLEATMPGLRILTAPNAEAALVIARKDPVDVVVSDLRMPGMDGLQLLEHIHQRYPLVRRILITAFSEPGLEARAHELGVGAVMRKPFPMQEFRETLGEALDAS